MSTNEELERQLAEIKEQRARVHKSRADRIEASSLKARIEAEQLALEIETAVAELELEHGELGKKLMRVDARHPDGTIVGAIVVKAPQPQIYRRFRNTIGDLKGVKKDEALEQLFRPSIVWPKDSRRVDAMLEQFPRLADQLGDAVALLAGAREEEATGKS